MIMKFLRDHINILLVAYFGIHSLKKQQARLTK